MLEKKQTPEDFVPPVFWTPATAQDIDVLVAQRTGRRFDPSIVKFVAKRCGAGFPQVVVCAPLSNNGHPFPTLFWLTCPYLDKKCGALESQQKIRELENSLKQQQETLQRWHSEYAALRVSLLHAEERAALAAERPAIWKSISETGVGGIDSAASASAPKCLHLQAATWLGMGKHPAEDWLRAHLGALDCGRQSCREYLAKK